MRVVPVPQLEDNYGYLIIAPSGEAAIVDPAEPDLVIAAAAAEGARISTVLNTHHHSDHSGGNEGLARVIAGLRVVGSAEDAPKIPAITERVRHDDAVEFGGLSGRVLSIPCHTGGHVAYLFGQDLFTGDTLFLGGCGKFFEGTAKDMYHALYEVLGALPGETRVWCGHEYTEKNLAFAASLERSNERLHQKRVAVAKLRAEKRPTVPGTLEEERAINPFLRVFAGEIKAAAAKTGADPADPVAVLGAIRALKDTFK